MPLARAGRRPPHIEAVTATSPEILNRADPILPAGPAGGVLADSRCLDHLAQVATLLLALQSETTNHRQADLWAATRTPVPGQRSQNRQQDTNFQRTTLRVLMMRLQYRRLQC